MNTADVLLNIPREQQQKFFDATKQLLDICDSSGISKNNLLEILESFMSSENFMSLSNQIEDLDFYAVSINVEIELSDKVASPEEYEVGDILMDSSFDISPFRADEINKGSALNVSEIEALKGILLENAEFEDHRHCGGFLLRFSDGTSLLLGFSGGMAGQGGWEPEFDAFFENHLAAVKYYSSFGDEFFEFK